MSNQRHSWILAAGLIPQPNEGGLLGLAFHPDYFNTGTFFVNYTTSASNHAEDSISRASASRRIPMWPILTAKIFC